MTTPIKNWRDKNKYQYLGKYGKIVCLTRIYNPTTGFSKSVPYDIGIIEFGNKKRVVGQIVNEKNEEIKIKERVVGIIRKGKEVASDEIIEYLVKFKTL